MRYVSVLFIAVTLFGFGAPGRAAVHTVFFDDFSTYREPSPLGQYPESLLSQIADSAAAGRANPVLGWEVLSDSHHGHLHRQIDDGAYWITRQGNSHCPISPAVADFTLEFDARVHDAAKVAALFVDFRFDRTTRQGYRIYYRWGEAGAVRKQLGTLAEQYGKYVPTTARLALLDYQHRDGLEPIITKKVPDFGSPLGPDPILVETPAEKLKEMADVMSWQHFKVVAVGNAVEFYHNGHLQATLTDPGKRHTEPGRIGFDTIGPWGVFAGGLVLDNVRISVAKPPPVKTVFQRSVVFPYRVNAIHGQKPTYTVRIRKLGDVHEVTARFAGGPAADYGPKTPLKHTLVNPYIRIEDARSQRVWPILLFAGKIGGRYPQKVGPLGMNDHMGPVERTTTIRDLPDQWRLHLGYDYYHVIGRDHQSGGPSEILVSPHDGAIHYFGRAMRNGFGLHVDSPAEKAVLGRVRTDNKLYEGFKTFMEQNHYFCVDEAIRFEGRLWATNRFDPAGLTLRLEVLDAFFEPLGENVEATLTAQPAPEMISLGVRYLTTGWQVLNARPAGVYHLRARLLRGEEELHELTRAFEVLPAAGGPKSPAELSGLPNVGFKPYVTEDAYQVDAYHYCSYWGNTLSADWVELSNALCRRFYGIGADLNTDEAVAQQNDVLRGTWALFSPKYKRLNVCYFWSPNTYARPIVQQLVRDYIRDRKPAGALPGLVGKTDADGAHSLYMELRSRHWRDWIDYINGRFSQSHRELRARVHRVHPGAEFYSYGHPMPCGNDLIGLDFCRIGGLDFVSDNVFYDACLFEGYFTDHRHSIDRTVITMALLKMVCPRVEIIEDNEGDCVCVEDGQNARAWAPYGVTVLRPGFQKKAMLMQLLAGMYFDGERFGWSDGSVRPGAYVPERWRELIAAVRLRRRMPIDRPVRTIAFAWDWDAIRAYDFLWDDLNHPYNPADETLVFAGEEVPRNGNPAGYVCRLRDVAKLPECDTIILPPLKSAKPELLAAIRRRHQAGVHLVGFQDVAGLEDLFGIEPADDGKQIASLTPADNPLAKRLTSDLTEQRVHYRGRLGQVRYRLTDATPVLDACDETGRTIGPALVVRKGTNANTAFWCIPPTDVWRERIASTNCAGEVMSELVKRCMGRVVREIATTPVTTTAGQVMAFWGKDDRLYVLSLENAFPDPARIIRPIVSVRMPGIDKAEVTADKPFQIVGRTADTVSVATTLGPEEMCLYVITPEGRK